MAVVIATVVFVTIAITALRIVGFMGARNVLHLIIGAYHRPVIEKRAFLFLGGHSEARDTDMVAKQCARTVHQLTDATPV